MPNIYEKNLTALEKVNSELAKQLKDIKSNEKFEVFQGSKNNAINILQVQNNEPLYDNPIETYNAKTQEYKKLREYPYLYFFGIGNGNEIESLLENSKLERVVLIEPEIEMLYIAFNLNDFSDYITSAKIVFLLPSQLTFELALRLFGQHKSRFYAKVYNLHVLLPFYEEYNNDIINVNETLIKAINYVISFSGNDVTDNLTGLKHHIQNTPIMLKNGKLSELITKKNCNIAIIVSTGPSLHKQLSRLKKIQDYATIISVDASLPILEKHSIKPDIVTSIERVEPTSMFFKKTSKNFQKEIIMLSASLQHPDTIKAIKGKKVLAMRPFDYNRYFHLDDYGYIGNGMSSANLAYELAIKMQYTKIVLIGQDLAFAKDGNSHSEGHIFNTNNVKKSDTQDENLIEAYGGDGKVASAFAWILFRNSFEQIIETNGENIKTINATEGGARIKGSIEMPFKDVIESYIDKTCKKEEISIKQENDEYKKQLKSSKSKINKLIKGGMVFSKKIEDYFLTIQKAVEKLENTTEEEALEKFNTSETALLIQEIEKARTFIDNDETFNEFYYDFVQSDLLHIELDLATIKVRYIDNPKDNQKKALQWIFLHRELLFTLAGTIKNTMGIIKKAKKKWST